MNQMQAFILPVIIHALYTAVLGLRMANARVSAAKAGKVKIKEIALSPATWPNEAKKLANNFDNQFDLPTTWYAFTGLVLVTAKLDVVFVLLTWLFLVLRIWHSLEHTTGNRLPLRMYIYAGGLSVMVAMWLWFALRLFIG
jgi:hypothetical protein